MDLLSVTAFIQWYRTHILVHLGGLLLLELGWKLCLDPKMEGQYSVLKQGF